MCNNHTKHVINNKNPCTNFNVQTHRQQYNGKQDDKAKVEIQENESTTRWTSNIPFLITRVHFSSSLKHF
nr:hypothetical protein Iba_chr07aCG4350 [Ipomoea batatas]